MKVLFDHPLPFSLAHGGLQYQIEQTKAALERAGVQTEFLRWWDAAQGGDLIHFFGAVKCDYLAQAHVRKLPVVLTAFFSETCNRSDVRLACQGWLTRSLLALPFGHSIKQQLAWWTYSGCAQVIVGLEAERRVLQTVYRVPSGRISVVPLGLSHSYLQSGPALRNEPHLICPGTIRPLKHPVELATLARAAQAPMLFVGKPYHPNDPCWLHFKTLVDDRWVKYHPHVTEEAEMIRLFRSARGFVLMSDFENWSLAAHEAAACGLPLLLQDQKWSRERFGSQARYFERIGVSAKNVDLLRQFYAEAPDLAAPRIQLESWDEVALRLAAVYERVLRNAR